MSWRSFKKDVRRTQAGELRGPSLHEKFEADEAHKERQKAYTKESNFDPRFKSKAFSPHSFRRLHIIERYPKAFTLTFTAVSLSLLYSRFIYGLLFEKPNTPRALENTRILDEWSKKNLWFVSPDYFLGRGFYAPEAIKERNRRAKEYRLASERE